MVTFFNINIVAKNELLIGPSDVGGTCPTPTYPYREGASRETCCCGNGCCWDKCIDHIVDDYPDCLDSVSGAFWEWDNDLEAAVAKRGNPG